MVKDKSVNVLLLCLGIAGCVVSYFLGELLLVFLNPLPYIVQAGIYMVFAAAVCGIIIMISETVLPGGYVQDVRIFYKDRIKSFLVCILIAFGIGFLTQLLYGAISIQLFSNPVNFQGTMLICDKSGSMTENDPDRDAVGAMISYIDKIPLGEYVGIITFSTGYELLREYKRLETDEEREELKEYLNNNITYDGSTSTQDALLAGIDEVRKIKGAYPGLIILFSDGLATPPFSYSAIQKAARGNYKTGEYEVPVNTVYFANNGLGGYQMSKIAQDTGGTYNYSAVKDRAEDIFSKSRASYSVEKLHLLQKTFGEKRDSPLRIILQSLFIGIWCFFISLLAFIILDNTNLIRDFLFWRVFISIAAGIIFTVLMNILDYDIFVIARLMLMGFMVILFIPTYKLTSSRRSEE